MLVCLLNTGTRFRIATLGYNNISHPSFTVLRFHYISGAANTQRAGLEARFISRFSVHRLHPSLLRHPFPLPQVLLGVNGVTLLSPPVVVTDGNRPLLFLPMDHCYLKQHGSKKNTKMFWRSLSILLHRWANYLDSFKNSARPLCVRRNKSLAFAKSFLQPRHQPARFEHTTCRLSGSCCGVPTGNCHRASVSSKLPISTLPISWRS